jgi:hypothetical protein
MLWIPLLLSFHEALLIAVITVAAITVYAFIKSI